MELWIRSQDKENLSKAEHLGVYNEKIYVNGYEDNGYCVGIYKTKERALEVLDEIQKIVGWVNTNMKNVTYGELQDLSGSFENYVYQMPEE